MNPWVDCERCGQLVKALHFFFHADVLRRRRWQGDYTE